MVQLTNKDNVVEMTGKAGTVPINKGRDPRQLYEHQVQAIQKLDALDKKDNYSALLVLPTGGGKTRTAVYWLLRNAINNEKKFCGLLTDICCWSKRRKLSFLMRLVT